MTTDKTIQSVGVAMLAVFRDYLLGAFESAEEGGSMCLAVPTGITVRPGEPAKLAWAGPFKIELDFRLPRSVSGAEFDSENNTLVFRKKTKYVYEIWHCDKRCRPSANSRRLFADIGPATEYLNRVNKSGDTAVMYLVELR